MKPESTFNLRDPIWFRETFKTIMREWAQYLTLRQLGVLLFVFDRTAAWGKEWELIRYRSFVEGITSKDGSVRYAAGVCGCIRTAENIACELIVMGMLLKRRSQQGNYWSLNYNWKPYDMKKLKRLVRNTQKLADPNTQKPAGSNTQEPAWHKYTVKENVSQNETLSRPSGREGGFDFHKQLSMAKAKGQAALDRKAIKRAGKFNSGEISLLWSRLIRKAPWNEYITPREAITKREAQALKSYSDRFLTSLPKESFGDYLEWGIDNWPGIMSDLFKWMTQAPPPQVPAAMFFIKWAERFENLYLQRLAFERRMRMTPVEREVAALVSKGMSLEDAERKAAPIARTLTKTEAPVTRTVVLKRKTRAFSNRKTKENFVSLPSMGDMESDYED